MKWRHSVFRLFDHVGIPQLLFSVFPGREASISRIEFKIRLHRRPTFMRGPSCQGQKLSLMMQEHQFTSTVRKLTPEVRGFTQVQSCFSFSLNLSKDQWRPLTGMMPLVENYITGLFHARCKPPVLRFQINTWRTQWTKRLVKFSLNLLLFSLTSDGVTFIVFDWPSVINCHTVWLFGSASHEVSFHFD